MEKESVLCVDCGIDKKVPGFGICKGCMDRRYERHEKVKMMYHNQIKGKQEFDVSYYLGNGGDLSPGGGRYYIVMVVKALKARFVYGKNNDWMEMAKFNTKEVNNWEGEIFGIMVFGSLEDALEQIDKFVNK